MRLLLDANLSPRLVQRLADDGIAADHVAALGLAAASDEEIFTYAADEELVIVTADSDFSMILALRRTRTPSVVLLRNVAQLRPFDHARLLVANLPSVVDDLDEGAIVSLSPTRLAVRPLPIR